MSFLASVFKRDVDSSAAEPVTQSTFTVSESHVETTGAEVQEGIRSYTLTDGRQSPIYTHSGSRIIPAFSETLSPLLSGSRIVARGDMYSPSYAAAPVYHAAPAYEDRVLIPSTSPVGLVAPYRYPGAPIMTPSSAAAARISIPVQVPASAGNLTVAEYPSNYQRYDGGSYSPARASATLLPAIRDGKAVQSTADRVAASAAASAAQSGFVRIGDEYFPSDNYQAPIGSHYVEGETTPVTTAAGETRSYVAQHVTAVPRDPVKLRHTSRTDYVQYRTTQPPTLLTAQ